MGEIVPFIGAVRIMPAENPLKTKRHWVTMRPVRCPVRRKIVPRASHGTLITAPKRKKTRNEAELQPRASAHHSARAATAKRPMAIVHAISWGFRLRSQRSKVLRPNATAIMKEVAAKAVFSVTGLHARRDDTDFVKSCTK